MAVTAHFIARSVSNILTLEMRLVAFRPLHGSHTGVNLAKEFLTILKEIEYLNKVRPHRALIFNLINYCAQISMITLDNARNNQAMMRELEIELKNLGIPFDRDGNRVRYAACFV